MELSVLIFQKEGGIHGCMGWGGPDQGEESNLDSEEDGESQAPSPAS